MPIAVVVTGLLIGLVVGGYLWMKATRTSLYWFTGHGFRAQQFHESPPHRKATADEIRTAIRALLEKRVIDCLMIFASPEPHAEGVSFDSIYGDLRLSMQFLVSKELECKARCIEALAGLGLEPLKEHPWNVGMGPDLEMVTVSFPIAEDADVLYEAAEVALAARTGIGPELRFLSGMDLGSFPTREKGPALVRFRDPLDEVLGPRHDAC